MIKLSPSPSERPDRGDPARPPISQDALLIGDAARELGISPSLIRKYDSRGLVVLPRDEHGYRWVERMELDRIRELRAYMQTHRLDIRAVLRRAAMLPCWLIRQCEDRERTACDHIGSAETPCWAKFRDSGGCLHRRCTTCTLYCDTTIWLDRVQQLVENAPGVRASA